MTPLTQLASSATAVLVVAAALLTTEVGDPPAVDAAASATALRDPTEAPAATIEVPSAPRDELPRATPRSTAPDRVAQVAAAPEPEPEPVAAAPKPAAATGSSDGSRMIAAGTSTDPVDRGGSTVRWSLEVEVATGVDLAAALATAEAALYDERSWARDKTLVRIDDPSRAHIRIVIGTPATVDALCAKAGLNTGGWLSCWNGSTAAINSDRWTSATSEITDLALYRRYVINHEVGHGLGHGHVECRGAGQLASVMQQQTKSLDGCVANDWPYPDA